MPSLFPFPGGVKPPTYKSLSEDQPILKAPLPTRLILPLQQSIGPSPQTLVQIGDRVLKGQRIAAANGRFSTALHAPTSGIVQAIGNFPRPHPSGLDAPAIVIESDGQDQWIDLQPFDHKKASLNATEIFLQNSGLVGLGGAGFPTHGKVHDPIDELIINAAECEPFISCDDRLMQERADEIIAGIGVLRDLCHPKKTLIGIEDNKPLAFAALEKAILLAKEDFQIIQVPTRYPAGGAKQLIRVLTGKSIPGTLRATSERGVQVFNVATAYSVARAIFHGEPLISRMVTVTGNVVRAGNFDVLLGTPIEAVLALAEPLPDTDGILLGGPMMGHKVLDVTAPLIKTSNCLIATSPALFPPPAMEMPCIRCTACADACPHELQPYEMYRFAQAKNFGRAQEYNLFDCIECGCCSFVCPSSIPLVQYFRFAKSEIWAREKEKNAADVAKQRFEFKQYREERDKTEKAAKLAKAAALQAEKAENAAISPDAVKKALIAVAMEKAAAKRAEEKQSEPK